MPPGTMADTSPGTVFLFAAMCTDSITFSTLDPSIPCKKQVDVDKNLDSLIRVANNLYQVATYGSLLSTNQLLVTYYIKSQTI